MRILCPLLLTSARMSSAEKVGLPSMTCTCESACIMGMRTSRPLSAITITFSGVSTDEGARPLLTITAACSLRASHSAGDGGATSAAVSAVPILASPWRGAASRLLAFSIIRHPSPTTGS